MISCRISSSDYNSGWKTFQLRRGWFLRTLLVKPGTSPLEVKHPNAEFLFCTPMYYFDLPTRSLSVCLDVMMSSSPFAVEAGPMHSLLSRNLMRTSWGGLFESCNGHLSWQIWTLGRKEFTPPKERLGDKNRSTETKTNRKCCRQPLH